MAATDILHDTTPCPPPGSGEHAVVQIKIRRGDGQQAPRYVDSVVGELRSSLAALRCMDHGAAPALTVEFGQDDDATVAVVPYNCCRKLDDLVADALKGSGIFRVIRLA